MAASLPAAPGTGGLHATGCTCALLAWAHRHLKFIDNTSITRKERQEERLFKRNERRDLINEWKNRTRKIKCKTFFLSLRFHHNKKVSEMQITLLVCQQFLLYYITLVYYFLFLFLVSSSFSFSFFFFFFFFFFFSDGCLHCSDLGAR